MCSRASLTAGNLGIAGPIAHHELPTDDLSLLVADGLAVVVHLETGDGIGRPHVGIVAVALGRPAALLRRGVGPLEHVGAALGGRLLRVLPSGLGHCCWWFQVEREIAETESQRTMKSPRRRKMRARGGFTGLSEGLTGEGKINFFAKGSHSNANHPG